MNTGRPDPLDRLDATAEAVRDLVEIADDEEPLDDVLTRVAATAARAIPDADAVTITVLTGDRPHTAAWTDERLVDIDTRQYQADRGPCLDSARTHQAVRATVGEGREDWPEFTSAAEQAGIRAYLSVPLLIDSRGNEQELVGPLNVYSRTATAFDPFDGGLLRLYTTTAAAAITNARRWQRSRETIGHLETALTSRAEIDQAKGVLMALHGCTAEEAFARLIKQSQHTNTKLSKIARDLLASIRTRLDSRGDATTRST